MNDFYITCDLHKILLHTIWETLLALAGQSSVKCDTIFLSSIDGSEWELSSPLHVPGSLNMTAET